VPASASPGVQDDLAKPTKLKDAVAIERPLPVPPSTHDYRFGTDSVFWSVVAVEPDDGSDADLSVWDNGRQTKLLAESRSSSDFVDFVAIDNNHRAPDSVFPEVSAYEGTGDYVIQLAQRKDVLVWDTQTLAFGATDLVRVRDTLLQAGQTYRFTLAPNNPSLDGSLYLMDSLPPMVDSWVKPKAEAMASAAALTGPVVLEVTAPRTDWYGLVITNELLGGTYTVTRS
jgi:hypothetical protein